MSETEKLLDGFYTMGPASVELRIDYLRLRELLASGALPQFPKLGGKTVIHRADFDTIRAAARRAGILAAEAPSGSAA